ncbi:MAG: hypothetical protein MUO67_15720, partial [Anaerolineales bacterium]|nr:hypothetical protein [Anaerolineales bacterium]
MKVQILDRCEFCDGEAYVFVSEEIDARGNAFDRYRPCEVLWNGPADTSGSARRLQEKLAELHITITTPQTG